MFKTVFAELPSRADQQKQPYKFGGKELDRVYGFDTYDFSARMYDPVVGRFLTMDPLAEKYYSISPYAYCANNPVRFIDPTGKTPGDFLDMEGNKIGSDGKDDDLFYIVTDMSERTSIQNNNKKGETTSLDNVPSAKKVLSVESITGDSRDKIPFDGKSFNELFTEEKQKEIIKEGTKNVDGYLDIIKESNRGSLDYNSTFEAGQLINLNGTYMNNHEALNYMWGASLNEVMRNGKAPMGVGDALIGAQVYHMYDAVKGRSEGPINQPNHNKAIKLGWASNETRRVQNKNK